MNAVETTSPHHADAAAQILLECARAAVSPGTAARKSVLAGPVDWTLLIQTAHDHGVLPLLHRAVESAGADVVPPPERELLHRRVRDNTHQNLLLMRALLQLLSRMQSENIRVLAYKGPLLAMLGYGDLSLRQSGDLDMLVPSSDLSRARALLAAAGYTPTREMDEFEEAAYLASPHEYDFAYLSPDGFVMVELHWRVVGSMFSFAPDPLDLWARSTPRRIAGAQIRVLAPEDLLLILCAHGMKHFWTRLGWICDIAMLVRNTPQLDWRIVMSRATQLGARNMTLLGLALAHNILGAAVPRDVLDQARGGVQSQAAELEKQLFAESQDTASLPRGAVARLASGSSFKSLLFHMRSRESLASGLRYCFHRVLTPNAVDQTWLRLPHRISFLHYALRPLRLLSRSAARDGTRTYND